MSYDPSSAIIEDYASSLRELTFNSRPIIDNLTTIAKENTDVADGILNVITQRIYKCIPEQKLFSLYLLDSICKTVGNPYNILIGDEIFKLFSHVYLLVNDTVRKKLNNLFETWKMTKTKGTALPIFPKEQLDKIGKFLSQAGYKGKVNDDKVLTNSSLIKDIDTLIPIFQNKLINNPDPELNDRFNALSQLKVLLSNQTMQKNDLIAVQTKLTAIKQQELATATSPIPQNTHINVKESQTPGIPQVPPAINHTNKANELFNALIISGLVKVDQSLKPGSKPHYEVVLPKIKYNPTTTSATSINKTETNEVEDFFLKYTQYLSNTTVYEQLKYNEILKLSKKLSTSKSTKINLQNFINSNDLEQLSLQLLYECKASKCGICGKRFTNDEIGTTRKQLHLDWHFRINKKLGNQNSNIQSRNWYLDDYDWVKFRDDNLLEFNTNNLSNEANMIQDNDTTSKPIPYVVIPSNETNMNNKCLICRESIKATYNDDIGEWCWYNCIASPNDKTNRKIFHATCFNEASKKRGADEDLNSKVKREKV
ncbi:hypothetical protein HYPBUDRAFT_128458 [Hyphopichia burtonii NRRL Y-1933]|uniref:CID domain-containing protein n=1 Tax=Hyphopichia burtonii NRRL Y-1933 TaxID=984485 RepID=A0A1E4REB7_9ASCO|nr:hypothetical protein HYPBUDRAFT_128458 [Hyphopichia burtonii NRRL Y-1933]ODV65590.1 hypothetical protein HYPBUDRAFT_128458 [Hyphopichia burtonii NRRL Y-1933]